MTSTDSHQAKRLPMCSETTVVPRGTVRCQEATNVIGPKDLSGRDCRSNWRRKTEILDEIESIMRSGSSWQIKGQAHVGGIRVIVLPERQYSNSMRRSGPTRPSAGLERTGSSFFGKWSAYICSRGWSTPWCLLTFLSPTRRQELTGRICDLC